MVDPMETKHQLQAVAAPTSSLNALDIPGMEAGRQSTVQRSREGPQPAHLSDTGPPVMLGGACRGGNNPTLGPTPHTTC